LFGNGKGGFASPVNYPANEPGPVAVADVNRDGKADIVFAGYNSIGTLPGKGDGTFGLAIYSPCFGCKNALVVADFNGDGKPDVVTWSSTSSGGDYLVLLLGNGDGTFQGAIDILAASPGSFASADFNNDGRPDLVVAYAPGTFILLNDGQGGFAAPALLTIYGNLGAVADFNGDGNVDIAIELYSSSQTGTIYLGNGNGTFIPEFTIDAPGTPAIAGDFNGDGILDLLGTDGASGLAFVLLGKGDGTFVRQTQEFVIPPPTSISVTGDFNGDGKLDLASFDYDSPLWILLNTTKP
jgi:FG-GAP-like repeat